MEQIKVGIIGIGHWGKNLLRNFHQLNAVVQVCDVDPAMADRAAELAPGIPFTTDPDAVIASPECRAVVIAAPAANHARLVKSCLDAGKDVFVEKPLALRASDGRKLVEQAEAAGRILMVGHILNYHPAFLTLKKLVHSGELGRIRYIYSNRLNIGKIRTEENILWSFAPHDISAILALLGEQPEAVTCQGECYINDAIYDVTMTEMTFPGKIRSHIFVSWLHPFKEQRLVVVGSDKMAVLDDTIPDKLKLYPHSVTWKDRIPTAVKADADVVPVDSTEPLRAECMHFLECVAERRQPRTDGREALRVLDVLEACQESLKQNGTRVSPADLAARPAYFKHDTAFVDLPCDIGRNTKIWHFAHVMKGAKIGEDCVLGQNVNVGGGAVIGNNVKIQNNVSVYDEVILEDHVFCGPSMVFTNVMNPRSEIVRKHEYMRTHVKRGATLGANCTVVCGNTIGEYAFVAAGAVVAKDVRPYALVAGVPAIQVGWMCRCGVRLTLVDGQGECGACGRRYKQHGRHLIPEDRE